MTGAPLQRPSKAQFAAAALAMAVVVLASNILVQFADIFEFQARLRATASATLMPSTPAESMPPA